MTLSIGDHVVKLGPDGNPIPAGYDQESYVEFEVIDLSPTYEQGEDSVDPPVSGRRYHVVQFAKLRKIR